jgi:hypothetical protein
MSIASGLKTLLKLAGDDFEVIMALFYNEVHREALKEIIRDPDATLVNTTRPREIALLIPVDEFRKLDESIRVKTWGRALPYQACFVVVPPSVRQLLLEVCVEWTQLVASPSKRLAPRDFVALLRQSYPGEFSVAFYEEGAGHDDLLTILQVDLQYRGPATGFSFASTLNPRQ